MQYLKIKTLTLENFKGVSYFQGDFDQENVILTGANGAGKSTVFDAFAWLVYGTDSQGRGEKTIQVKPLTDRGTTRDREAVTSVELSCTLDGRPLLLKKEMFEQWSVPKGDTAPRLEGNRFRFFYQGMPVRRSRFEEVTQELFRPPLGRLQTGVVRLWEDLHWKQRQELLCTIAQTPSDRSLMESDPSMAELLSQMDSDSAQSLRQRYSKQKAQYTGLRANLNAKLEETREIIRIMSQRMEMIHAQLCENQRNMEKTENSLFLLWKLAQRKSACLETSLRQLLSPLVLRLKRPLLDGSFEDCCEILYGGIPYGNLSTGQKIRVDLMLAARLAEVMDLCLPCFVDNAEALTEQIDYPGQCIRLVTGTGPLEVMPCGKEAHQSGDHLQ